jgi:hypothetical protein
MESTPANKRMWIIAGSVVVGIALAVLTFILVMRSGKKGGPSASSPAASSSCGCVSAGTECVAGVCELSPKAAWMLLPMRVTFAAAASGAAQPAPPSDVVLCSRPTGGSDWKCTKPVRSVAAAPSSSTQHADFPPEAAAGGQVVVSTEALRATGIDVEVRRADTAIASATGLHHKTLRPGATLFQGGLRFGAKDKGVSDVLYKFKANE